MEYLPWLDHECMGHFFYLQARLSTKHFYRFPLFSKGVDTYRFEYAVFLLNKDIEMV